MNRYFPVLSSFYGSPYAEMEEDSLGDYIRIEDVVLWIRQQRNENPVTGEELAEALLYALGEKK